MTAGTRKGWRWRTATVVLVLSSMMVPVLLALLLVRQQARGDQARRAEFYAADVLHRSEQTADQVAAAFRDLSEAGADPGCDPATRALLQRIDATSSYLQMVGLLRGNAVVCSSYGALDPPLDLGPIGYVSSTGTQIRQDAALAIAPGQPMSVISNGRYAAVIHKALPVDTTLGGPGASLALLTASQPRTFAVRGPFDTAWRPQAGALAPGETRTLQVGDHVVAQIRSSRFDMIAIAALDQRDYDGAFVHFARVLLPVGVLVGGLLAWLLLRVVRAQAGMGAAIRGGLRADEFFIHLQPIVDLESRRWTGAEVLLRWKRRDGEFVRPDLFIPAAEENGSILAITARVLEKSEPVLAALAKRDGSTFLSINLSVQDLLSDRTLPQLRRLIARTGARPHQVHVEVTERGFANTEAARERVRAIRDAGICVSIDDFGTGYSSLSELVAFELDTLKIDKTFVDTIGGEQVTSHVAFHIVEMARSLKLEMVAEGIEHEQQAAILAQWRVRYGQGWLFSRPLAPDDFLRGLDEASPHAA